MPTIRVAYVVTKQVLFNKMPSVWADSRPSSTQSRELTAAATSIGHRLERWH